MTILTAVNDGGTTRETTVLTISAVLCSFRIGIQSEGHNTIQNTTNKWSAYTTIHKYIVDIYKSWSKISDEL